VGFRSFLFLAKKKILVWWTGVFVGGFADFWCFVGGKSWCSCGGLMVGCGV
jgi:hypothetical protein